MSVAQNNVNFFLGCTAHLRRRRQSSSGGGNWLAFQMSHPTQILGPGRIFSSPCPNLPRIPRYSCALWRISNRTVALQSTGCSVRSPHFSFDVGHAPGFDCYLPDALPARFYHGLALLNWFAFFFSRAPFRELVKSSCESDGWGARAKLGGWSEQHESETNEPQPLAPGCSLSP